MNSVQKILSDNSVELKEIIVNLQHRIDQLEEFIRLQKHRQFGASSEQAPGQGELFDEAEDLVQDLADGADPTADTEASAEATPATAAQTNPPARTKKPGRKPLPAGLPRVRIERDLPEADKICPCGCQRTLIGEETSEQLDVVPASVRVLVHVRKKYACKACETGVALSPLPPQPIPISLASPGLLAYVATAKYQDGLPLHRQEALFQRIDIALGRHTLARWMIRAAGLLQPLWNLFEDQLLSGSYVHADETPVQVLKEADKPPQSRSYMWVRVSGLPDQKVILFDYAPGRGGDIAQGLIADYQGHLQTDDYAGYNAVCATPGITQLGCWAACPAQVRRGAKGGGQPQRQTGQNW